ncbi:SWIM zinc finger family protein [Tritrichomonas foetus]|uniref:SWIM zinc finger family protein n=1 Tax=Tritrichomonas foetus TaxID=1144522 RepID=A0A1J4KVV9_9EUKA|nr:SWIM zinc finger family protein [Tritrichomonas foetus]|eukprot:OHT13653.1 SWIM zinc finger family protein [Tritrichomonas foetus]
MRSAPYLPHPAFTTQEAIEEITRHEVTFAIEPRGPSKFRLKSMTSKEFWIVSIGSQQTCTCKDTEVCVHIIYIMMRYFGVPKDCDILWQKALTDHEIDIVLDGRVKRQSPPPKPQPLYKTKSGKSKVKRLPIGDEDVCPICYDDLKGCEKSKIAWCRLGCGGNFHRKCVKSWIDSQRNSGKEPLCPICRQRLDMLGINPPKKPPPNAPPPLTEAEIRELMNREITPDDYDLLLKLDQINCANHSHLHGGPMHNAQHRWPKVTRVNNGNTNNNNRIQAANRILRDPPDLQLNVTNVMQDTRQPVQRQIRRVTPGPSRRQQNQNVSPFFGEVTGNIMFDEHQQPPPPPPPLHQQNNQNPNRPTSGRLAPPDPQIRFPPVWHGGGAVSRTPVKRNVIPPKRPTHEHRGGPQINDSPQLLVSNFSLA